MCEKTADIKYIETGSELISLLKESSEIKKHLPYYNRSQKRRGEISGLVKYEDNNGIINLKLVDLKSTSQAITSFHTKRRAKEFLDSLREKHTLCSKYVGSTKERGRCFNSHLGNCNGICYGNESVEEYNKRVNEALNSILEIKGSFILLEKGRKENETGFVVVQNGTYLGYGFLSFGTKISKTEIEKNMTFQIDNRDVRRIIASYMKRNDVKILKQNFSINQIYLELEEGQITTTAIS